MRIRLLPLPILFLLAGCAGVRWVPLPNGATIDPATQSATQSRDGVTITAQASAWRGSPAGLDLYVTPIALQVLNGSAMILKISGEDLVIFDEARRQSTPLPPERVAAMFRSAVTPAGVSLALSVEAGSNVRPIRHRPFVRDPLFWDPFFWPPWWREPWPPAERVDDLFVQALPLGRVYPAAQIRGFVYFTRVDPAARRLTLRVGYAWEGAGSPGEMIFRFATQSLAGGAGGG